MHAPLKNVCFALVAFFFFPHLIFAQAGEKDAYEILSLQMELGGHYREDPAIRALVDSARVYAAQKDYVMALIFLEEARDSEAAAASFQDTPSVDTLPPQNIAFPRPFSLSVMSGVDFNRQEFELGYDQSDSVLLDQVSKPYVGLLLNYQPRVLPFSLKNILRYDQENFDNELRLTGRWLGPAHSFESRFSYLFNRNFIYDNLSYNELNADFIYGYGSGSWSLRLQNTSRLKKYQAPDINTPDYFRNTLNGDLSWLGGDFFATRLYYALDYNESSQTRNNDFLNQYLGLNSRFKNGGFSVRLNPRIDRNRFTYLVGDSILDNQSQAARIEALLAWRLARWLEFRGGGEYRNKSYLKKTEQEPDYRLGNLNPELRLYFNNQFSLGTGVFWEKRSHTVSDGLDSIYVLQQNYTDKGLTLNVDYASLSGRVLSLSLRYSARRYRDINTDANFSLYADRNIWSGLLFLQWPLTDHFSLQAIAMYDNDKDLDSAFNDSRSSFYTLELKYEF